MAETYTAFISPNFDFSTRQEIGREIIRYIQDRTKDGLGIGNVPFSGPDGDNKYSKNYTRHIDFKTGGKSGERTVNLTLTGDMLDSIEIIDASIPGRVEIGFEDGFENDKAKWMREKGYDFLGLTDAELSSIVGQFEEESGETFGNILRRFIEEEDGT